MTSLSVAHLFARREIIEAHARRIDRRWRGDLRQAIRSALIDAWGEGAIRPWRILSVTRHDVVVSGYARDPQGLAATQASRALGLTVETEAWELPAQGASDVFLVNAAALMTNTLPVAPGEAQPRCVDVADHPSYGTLLDRDGREGVYRAWLSFSMSAPRTGCRVVGDPVISSVIRENLPRAGSRAGSAVVPMMDAAVELEVLDRGTFGSFLTTGFRNFKHLGFGSVLPSDLVRVG